MSRLDMLVAAAREERADWSAARAARVLTHTKKRAARAKARRRAVTAAVVVVAATLVLLRAGAAPAVTSNAEGQAPAEVVALEQRGDAGFARD